MTIRNSVIEMPEFLVGRAGIEPATSCLSSKRSEPTELTSLLKHKNNKIC
jgi:hypothetical protein